MSFVLCYGGKCPGQGSGGAPAAVLRHPNPPAVVQIPGEGGQHAAASRGRHHGHRHARFSHRLSAVGKHDRGKVSRHSLVSGNKTKSKVSREWKNRKRSTLLVFSPRVLLEECSICDSSPNEERCFAHPE